MRRSTAFLGLLLFAAGCGGGAGSHALSAHGVRLVVPNGWKLVRPAKTPVTDPRTLLVVGTSGARPNASGCEIASYRVPAAGAVVVVVGWASPATAGGVPKPGRAPLERLTTVARPSFECFNGRGAGATVLLHGKPYQVNVLVGERASEHRVREALAVARSFARTG